MKHIITTINHHLENINFTVYSFFNKAKIELIGLLMGKEAQRKYILSQVRSSLGDYMLADIISLANTLDRKSGSFALIIEINDVAEGVMESSIIREITRRYFNEYKPSMTTRERREVTLKYLIEIGDIEENWKYHYGREVESWLKGENVIDPLAITLANFKSKQSF